MPHHELSHPSRAPASPSLTFAVDFEELLRTQVENLLSDWGVQWAVLGVLRQFYTLREGRITSKTKAGEYALDVLPERWRQIMREALRLRRGSPERNYPSRLQRAGDAYRFVRYMIETVNASLPKLLKGSLVE